MIKAQQSSQKVSYVKNKKNYLMAVMKFGITTAKEQSKYTRKNLVLSVEGQRFAKFVMEHVADGVELMGVPIIHVEGASKRVSAIPVLAKAITKPLQSLMIAVKQLYIQLRGCFILVEEALLVKTLLTPGQIVKIVRSQNRSILT